jgi:hypothetical protein
VVLSLNEITSINDKPNLGKSLISRAKFKHIIDDKIILKMPLKNTLEIDLAALKLTNNIQNSVSNSSSNPKKPY